MKIILLFLALFMHGSLHAQAGSDKNAGFEEITSHINNDEGFADVFLKIVSDTKTDSTHVYVAKGLHKKKVVGLQLEVRTKIDAGFVNGEVTGGNFKGIGFRMKSIGEESDEFIRAMAELYHQPKHKKFSKEIIGATLFSLESKDGSLDKPGNYKFKLFFGEEDEKYYGELFLHVNNEKKEIELTEKDEGYRAPLIKVWSK